MKPIVTGTEMRGIDHAAIESGRKSGLLLMKTAGAAAAAEIMRFVAGLKAVGHPVTQVGVLAGKGNNGGDGFVIAGLLHRTGGMQVHLYCACPAGELKGDALACFNELPEEIRCKIQHSPDPDGLSAHNDLLVDALLGTGCAGPLREPYAHWIAAINGAHLPVIAVDVPSGLNADSGEVCGDAVTADLTVTFQLVKTGMLADEGIRRCGRLRIPDIGLPRDLYERPQPELLTIGPEDAARFLEREPFDTYKNQRGHLLIVGGSSEYPSAPFLTAEAALRGGAGLVTVLLPAGAEIVCAVPRAVIVKRAPDDGTGHFTCASVPALEAAASRCDAVAVGPGMTSGPEVWPVLETILKKHLPTVLDADALNLLSAAPGRFGSLHELCVLTPHAGEMKRMLSALKAEAASPDRAGKARFLAVRTGATVLLKGPRTVTASPDLTYAAVNTSGCPALSTAGSGDVLSGVIGAMILRGRPIFDAVCAGVYLHGLAGESAQACGSRGVTADDLPGYVVSAMKKVSILS